MYEIATLKSKKLTELQEMAKSLGVKRITGLKKLDLIYQIIDFVSANPQTLSTKEPKKDKSFSARPKPQKEGRKNKPEDTAAKDQQTALKPETEQFRTYVIE